MKEAGALLGTIAAISLAILAIVGIKGCIEKDNREYQKKVDSGIYMPNDATDIVKVGNGWQEFTYKGQRFLFYRGDGIERGYQSIVKIDMPKPEAE